MFYVVTFNKAWGRQCTRHVCCLHPEGQFCKGRNCPPESLLSAVSALGKRVRLPHTCWPSPATVPGAVTVPENTQGVTTDKGPRGAAGRSLASFRESQAELKPALSAP